MRIVRRSFAALLGAGAFALLGAPGASGAVFCVQDPACVSGGGTSQPTLQSAFTAADGNGSGLDTVRIGATPTPIAGGSANGAVEVIGAGQGQTTITGGAGKVVDLNFAGSSIKNLSVQMSGSASAGVEAEGTASQVAVTGTTTSFAFAIQLSGGGINDHLNVDVAPASGGSVVTALAIVNTDPTTTTVEDSSLSGSAAATIANTGATATIRRTSLSGELAGVQAISTPKVVLESSTISVENENAAGLGFGTALLADQSVPSIDARHLTMVGPDAGKAIEVKAGCFTGAADLQLTSSIIRGFTTDVATTGASCPATYAATVSAADSIFDPAKVSATGAGGLTQGQGNLNVDPLFTNAAAGDFGLGAGSPAIDAGDPTGLGTGESATDLAGNPRIADGNGDGTARTDMGAFEVPAVVKPPLDPPEIARRLSLSYAKKKKAFNGEIDSDVRNCTAATVDVMLAGKKGKSKRIGSATTNDDGEFTLRKKAKRGKYFAQVAESAVAEGQCVSAKSKTVKVKGKKRK